MCDVVADMLTRIRNAQMSKITVVSVPYSNFRFSIAEVLKFEGYVEDFSIDSEKRYINIQLKYDRFGRAAIKEIVRLSKPSKRYYTSSVGIPVFYQGMATTIVSTSRGVMSHVSAKALNVGGEVLCMVF